MLIDFKRLFPSTACIPRASTASHAISHAIPGLAGFAGWLSIGPYFLWGSTLNLLIGALLMCVVFVLLFLNGDAKSLHFAEIVGVGILSAFVIYITLLPQYDGTIIRWIFVMPTMASLAMMPYSMRIRTITVFAVIFAVSLVPSILISLWVITGFPYTFETMPYYHGGMAAAGVKYLVAPLALFVETNSAFLPWGGAFIRTSGIYDEPGMVGTIAALLLATQRFQITTLTRLIVLIGGMVSGSLAFYIISIIGLGFSSAASRQQRATAQVRNLTLLLLVVIFGAILFGPVKLDSEDASSLELKVNESPAGSVRQVIISNDVRSSDAVNNRNLPEMQRLLDRYWAGSARTLLFGIAADATAKDAPSSQVFTRLLVDYGIVGFSLLIGGMAAISLYALATLPNKKWLSLFLTLFALSFYQRPTIWMPYTLTIFFCGLAMTGASIEQRSKQEG